MNIITKEDLLMDKFNNITVNPNKEISYYKNGEKKFIEVNGETYFTQPKRILVKEKLGVKNYNPLTFNFDLLNLSYKYHPSIPHYYKEDFDYDCSQNSYVNCIINLFIFGFLDKRIVDVSCGKFMKNYLPYKYSSYWDYLICNDEIDIFLSSYGFNNNCWYTIKVDAFFKIPFEKFKQNQRGKDVVHYRNLINFFKYYGINLKDNYKKKIDKYNEKKSQHRDLEQLEKQTNKKFYYYQPHIKEIQKTYIIKDDNTGFYKIGKSVNPVLREKTLQAQKPTYKLIKVFNDDIESKLHLKYKKYRIRGEWFKLNKIQLKYICTNYETKETHTDTKNTKT